MSNPVIRIKVENDELWFARKIDSTHVTLAREEAKLCSSFTVYHIMQLEGKSYYNDVFKLLKSSK